MKATGDKNEDGRRFLAMALVDAKMGDRRSIFVTHSPSQEHVYLLKVDEAQRFLSTYRSAMVAGEAHPHDWPMLRAHAVTFGVSLHDAANIILARVDETRRELAEIEIVRLTAKRMIREAAKIEDAERIAREL